MAWTTPVDQTTGHLVTATEYNLQIIDNLKYLHGDSGPVAFSSAIGYGTGSGGTVTISNLGSGTLNKTTGVITSGTAIVNTANGSYTCNNSTVAATDVVIVNIATGGSPSSTCSVIAVGAGSFSFYYTNQTGSTQTPTFNFAVIKGSSS